LLVPLFLGAGLKILIILGRKLAIEVVDNFSSGGIKHPISLRREDSEATWKPSAPGHGCSGRAV